MKTSDYSSGKKLSKPEIENQNQRTLEQVMIEIQEIINNTNWVQTRLAQLKACGYLIEDCWVKNGSIATIWYMKGKKVLRIQVTESESRGYYHKANCVIIPVSEILLQVSDASRVRNFPIKQNPEIDKSIQKSENISKNKKR